MLCAYLSTLSRARRQTAHAVNGSRNSSRLQAALAHRAGYKAVERIQEARLRRLRGIASVVPGHGRQLPFVVEDDMDDDIEEDRDYVGSESSDSDTDSGLEAETERAVGRGLINLIDIAVAGSRYL